VWCGVVWCGVVWCVLRACVVCGDVLASSTCRVRRAASEEKLDEKTQWKQDMIRAGMGKALEDEAAGVGVGAGAGAGAGGKQAELDGFQVSSAGLSLIPACACCTCECGSPCVCVTSDWALVLARSCRWTWTLGSSTTIATRTPRCSRLD
jgi:hypothetical protein